MAGTPSTDVAAASLTPSGDNRSPLRQALDSAIAEANGSKLSMKDLTVLSPQIDPFRLDTPANHKIGKWLADTAANLGSRQPEDPSARTPLHGDRLAEAVRYAVHQHRGRLAVAIR